MTPHLLARWEGATPAELARAWGVPRVYLFDRIGSTNDLARELAEEGAPSGTVVLAEEQVAGRGRGGRRWASPAGLGLWISLVLRAPVADPALLPLAVGIQVARALDPFTCPVRPRLKWPNDLLLGDRKLGGILCEGVWAGDALAFTIVGIGLNVLHSPNDFPPELHARATSIRIAAGWYPPRLNVAAAIIGAVLTASDAVGAGVLGPAALDEIESRDVLRGRGVVVTASETTAPLYGTALGIAPDGALLLRTSAGVLRRIRSGSVRLVSRSEPESLRRG